MNTLAPDIFMRLARPIQSGQAIMKKRSPTDKEYFVQDWFEKRLRDAGYTVEIQGRNSTPDFIVIQNGIIEGYEECDSPNLQGETCSTQGFSGGTLLCANECALDLSGCY